MSFNSKDYKGFTFRSGPSKNQTKSFSSFWDTSTDTDVDDFLGLDVDTPKGKDIVALAGYKRAIGNFVNIVTGKNIPVSFNNMMNLLLMVRELLLVLILMRRILMWLLVWLFTKVLTLSNQILIFLNN